VAAPLLCAVHCLATPLLVLVAPALLLGAAVEHAIMVASLVMAAAFLGWGIRIHRRFTVAAPALAGALLWVGGEALGSHSSGVLVLHAVGGLLLAGALALNARLRHNALCRACGVPRTPS
jgi:formylmethanofuran dehydrogenase subunit A